MPCQKINSACNDHTPLGAVKQSRPPSNRQHYSPEAGPCCGTRTAWLRQAVLRLTLSVLSRPHGFIRICLAVK
ncbi:hypothetical protein AAFF_G00292370 [Aldrovandia affinis]|uniref:Uncharacterized protein n=1 Tax=Aldrovandia affinis TaxID=143900 RepID=A0AAD7WRP7_9TELE|nr:hypothetical protein AAFF_G00292370 [Aldrovandia affinis]